MRATDPWNLMAPEEMYFDAVDSSGSAADLHDSLPSANLNQVIEYFHAQLFE